MAAEGIAQAMGRVQEIQSKIGSLISRARPMENDKPEAAGGEFSKYLEEAQTDQPVKSAAPDNLHKLFVEAGQKYNIPWQLIESVAKHESNFNPTAVSPKGAQGLMQIMPDTQRLLGVSDPFDPAQSIDGGAKYLKMQMDQFNGDMRKVLAAYNAGPENVKKYQGVPPFQETQNFVAKNMEQIASSMRRLGDSMGDF